jgi:maltooligosyltrehalose trehalohydrolase
VEAVRRGRVAEFASFGWRPEEIPDPQDEATFERSRVSAWNDDSEGSALFALHRELLRLRREHPALRRLDRDRVEVLCLEAEEVLVLHRWSGATGAEQRALLVASFAREPREVSLPAGRWRIAIDTEDPRWRGAGDAPGARGEVGPRVRVAPRSALVLVTTDP